MKKNGTGMLLGLFFVLLGISIVLKAVFKVDLPVLRVAFALFIIYFGVRLLLGTFGRESVFRWGDERTAVFSQGHFQGPESGSKGENTYSVVFGKSTLDLRKIPADQVGKRIQTNVVFGDCLVLLDPKTPVSIRANAAFGETRMPDGNLVAFGTLRFKNKEDQASGGKSAEVLRIEGNVVFGSLRFRFAEPGKVEPADDAEN